jgi:hypothetical protein
MRPALPADLPHRRPATAATLCLVPGLGQVYNRQPLKALWFVLGWSAALALVTQTFFHDHLSTPSVALFAATWIWMANDALVTAIRINGQVWTSRHSWAMFLALVAMISAVWFVTLAAISPLAYFRLIGTDTFTPLVAKGDIIWLDKWSLRFGGRPRRGELVYHDPKGFSMWRGNNVVFYDAQSFIERVIGLPGERVVVDHAGEETVIAVDGVTLPLDLHPLSTEYLPGHREFDVPPDHFLILQTKTMNEGFMPGVGLPEIAPSLSGLDLDEDRTWTESCLVHRDQLIGRVWLIASPPSRRRLFRRPEPEWMPR